MKKEGVKADSERENKSSIDENGLATWQQPAFRAKHYFNTPTAFQSAA
ncbi:hypothetical protein [Erwinia sp. 198]|nr:hypothetical protein [Erwinia sp. 198]